MVLHISKIQINYRITQKDRVNKLVICMATAALYAMSSRTKYRISSWKLRQNRMLSAINQRMHTNIKCKKSTAPLCTTQLMRVGRNRSSVPGCGSSARLKRQSKNGVFGCGIPAIFSRQLNMALSVPPYHLLSVNTSSIFLPHFEHIIFASYSV